MMQFTADALSDAILVVVCAALYWRNRQHCSIRLAYLLIAIAALLGVFRFSGFTTAIGPHQFFSSLATVAAIPLLGVALNWPNLLLNRFASAAALFVLFVGSLGIILQLFLPWWPTLCAAFGALAITLSWRWQRRPAYAMGIVFLLIAFAVSATQWSWQFLSSIQLLHYFMASGLILLTASKLPRPQPHV